MSTDDDETECIMNQKKKLFIMILIVSCIALLVSSIHILRWYWNTRQEQKELLQLANQTTIPSQEGDYLQVNFSYLERINPSVAGWIKVDGTDIDYPFVQGSDNSFYLTHSFHNTYSRSGWLFLDYRNNQNFKDKNNIIYAHSQTNRTMFGTLKNVLTEKWFQSADVHIVRTSTPIQNALWQVFSVYTIPTTTDYLQIDFDTDFTTFANKLIDRSVFDFHTTVEEGDKILTLSTCHNKTVKTVLHAKLIATQDR